MSASEIDIDWVKDCLFNQFGSLIAPEPGHEISAQVLVQALHEVPKQQFRQGLKLHGWHVVDFDSFYNQALPALTFRNCEFKELRMESAVTEGGIGFQDCLFDLIEMSHARIGGALQFVNPRSRLGGPLAIHLESAIVENLLHIEPPSKSTLVINLRGATIGNFLLHQGEYLMDPDQEDDSQDEVLHLDVRAPRSVINGDCQIYIQAPSVTGSFNFEDSIISSAFELSLKQAPSSLEASTAKVELMGRRARVRGSFNVAIARKIEGRIDLRDMVANDLNVVVVGGIESPAIESGMIPGFAVGGASIEKDALLTFGASVNASLSFERVRIGGNLSIAPTPGPRRVCLRGGINLEQMDLGGDFRLNPRGKTRVQLDKAIVLDDARVRGNVNMKLVTFRSPVSMRGAAIARNVLLSRV